MQVSQFLQQSKLDVWYKPGKEHIIPNVLSRLASANIRYLDPLYSELDVLFTYNITLVEMHPAMMSRILASYKTDAWWAQLQLQIQANSNLGADVATLLFVVGSTLPTDTNPYLTPCSNGDENLPISAMSIEKIPERLLALDKSKLLYHINKLTNVYCLCIPPFVAPDILAVAHGEGHPGFSRCYKRITYS